MTFELYLVRTINAEVEFVFDWWTDLSPDDARLVKPLKERKIISKTENVILLQDEEEMYFKKMKFDVKVTLERPKRWISEYDGNDARARSEYNLTANKDGTTTLSYHTKIEPKGLFTNAFSFVVKLFVKRIFAGEMKIFIQRLEEDYRARKQSADSSS